MDHTNGGLEDDFPFPKGWVLGIMLIFRGLSDYQRIMASIQTKTPRPPGSSKTSTETTQADPCRDDSSKFNSPSKSLSTTPRACVKKNIQKHAMVGWYLFLVHNSWILLIDGSEIRRFQTSWGKGTENLIVYRDENTSQVVVEDFFHQQYHLKLPHFEFLTLYVHADDLGHCKILQASHVASSLFFQKDPSHHIEHWTFCCRSHQFAKL